MAPAEKEDQITNEGDAPGWRPPQVPREPPQPQSPVFVDHLSKMGAGLDNQANYFSYFVVLAILCIVCYLVFHNKQKVSTLWLVFLLKVDWRIMAYEYDYIFFGLYGYE